MQYNDLLTRKEIDDALKELNKDIDTVNRLCIKYSRRGVSAEKVSNLTQVPVKIIAALYDYSKMHDLLLIERIIISNKNASLETKAKAIYNMFTSDSINIDSFYKKEI